MHIHSNGYETIWTQKVNPKQKFADHQNIKRPETQPAEQNKKPRNLTLGVKKN